MKRKLLFTSTALLVLAGAAGFVHYYNPFAPRIGGLLRFEPGKVRGLENAQMKYQTRAQTARKYQRYWNDIEAAMRGSGASDGEVRGVLATAQKHFSFHDEYSFIYGVPVHARRVWHRFQPIWIISFRWGVGYDDFSRGLTEPPGHVRVLGISGRKPYKQLDTWTCG